MNPARHNAASRESVIRSKSFDRPDRERPFPHGTGSFVEIDSLVIGRAVLEPGWRWSIDVKGAVGTEFCELHHLHVLLAGRMGFQMAGGDALEFGANAVVDVPPGHDAWVVGTEPALMLDISGNIADFGLPTSSARVLATMLMTDIVGSTGTAAALGDVAWKQLLAEHDRAIRRQLERFQGREINTTGDGFLAIFASARAALLCALAAVDTTQDLGMQLRAGVNTGEIEMLANDVRGLAVHATARITAAAQPSQVLASAVTRALAEGADLRFDHRGPFTLKGFDTPIVLFSVARVAAAVDSGH